MTAHAANKRGQFTLCKRLSRQPDLGVCVLLPTSMTSREVQSWMASTRLEEGEFIFGAGGSHSRSWKNESVQEHIESIKAHMTVKPPPAHTTVKPPPVQSPAVAPPPAVSPAPVPAAVETPPLSADIDDALLELFEQNDCAHLLVGPLASTTLAELQPLGRVALLARLKDLGVSKLPERQKLAGAIAKTLTGGASAAKRNDALEADYVIIGGGMTGVGICAELLDFRKSKSIIMLDRGSSAPASPDASSISSLARIEAAAISAAAPGRRSAYLTSRASASGLGIQASMGSFSSSSEHATSDGSPGIRPRNSDVARSHAPRPRALVVMSSAGC